MTHSFKQEWDLETALEILQHPTVDSQVWAEAVEWLLIYGPPEIKELITQASDHAAAESFPELAPVGYDRDGNPCYSVAQLAEALGITEEEAAASLAQKEKKHGVRHILDDDETTGLQ